VSVRHGLPDVASGGVVGFVLLAAQLLLVLAAALSARLLHARARLRPDAHTLAELQGGHV